VLARVGDLQHLVASCRGKIEMTLADDDASEDKLVQTLIGEAVKLVFNRAAADMDFDAVIEQFKGNLTFPAGDDLPADEFVANMKQLKGLLPAATRLAKTLQLDPGDVESLAATGDFILEGLYVNNRLSKYLARGKSFFKR
jgi:hypothetical protein